MTSTSERGNPDNRIGRFQVQRRIGRGLEGTVYLALDPDLERRVAIKVLHRDLEGDRTASLNEARNLGRLRHPNIVSIHALGRHQGMPYLVFEFVEGKTLREMLQQRGRLPLDKALKLMEQVVDAMAHAHAAGVMHLDISTGNIMLDKQGVPRVMDFGLSRLADSVDAAGEHIIGTPRYMSPEHFAEYPLGPYTDVYALGVVSYEVLAGDPLIAARGNEAIIRTIRQGGHDLGILDEIDPGGLVKAFIGKAVSRNPRERFADCGEMRDAFAELLRARNPLVRQDAGAQAMHSTIEFLLRRMERKGDFPAFSRTLVEINRMTAHDSKATNTRLANVILRDYAVTNKLLKLANSAFYAGITTEVKNITAAIRVLGMDQVRMACNSLMFFNHLQGKSGDSSLQDALISSFVSGLIARHLGSGLHLRDIEEAFICGMFHNVGRSLCIHYFPDEAREIRYLQRDQGLSREAAAREVLGLDYHELGIGVAREWKFSDEILASMRPYDEGPIPKPVNEPDKLRLLASFANALCEIAAGLDVEGKDAALDKLCRRYRPVMPLGPEQARKLLAAGIRNLQSYSPVLGISVNDIFFVRQALEWLQQGRQSRDEDHTPQEGPPLEVAMVPPVAQRTEVLEQETETSHGTGSKKTQAGPQKKSPGGLLQRLFHPARH